MHSCEYIYGTFTEDYKYPPKLKLNAGLCLSCTNIHYVFHIMDVCTWWVSPSEVEKSQTTTQDTLNKIHKWINGLWNRSKVESRKCFNNLLSVYASFVNDHDCSWQWMLNYLITDINEHKSIIQIWTNNALLTGIQRCLSFPVTWLMIMASHHFSWKS